MYTFINIISKKSAERIMNIGWNVLITKEYHNNILLTNYKEYRITNVVATNNIV